MVPHQKNKSVECFTFNFLNMGPNGTRYLLTCISKEFTCKCGCSGRHTTDAILEVLVWSLMVLMQGHWPGCRHDGTAFDETDKERAKQAGLLGFFAASLQVNGGLVMAEASLQLSLLGLQADLLEVLCRSR